MHPHGETRTHHGWRRWASTATRLASAVLVGSAGLLAVAAPAAHGATCDKTWAAAVSGSWEDGAKWTPSGVPAATDNVCIKVNGTYTVGVRFSQTAKSLDLGGTSGNQTLEVVGNGTGGHISLTLTNASTVRARGIVTLSSENGGYTSTLAANGGITSSGVINVNPGVGGPRNLVGTVVNKGAVNANVAVNVDSIDNQGALNVAAGTVVTLDGGSTFTNGTGGSVNVNATGLLVVAGSNWVQGAGTTSGPAPEIRGGSLTYTGTGASSLNFGGYLPTLTGLPSAGQTLLIQGNGVVGHTTVVLTGSATNTGTIVLSNRDGAYDETIRGAAGVVLTNSGVINAEPGLGGWRNFAIDMVNNGDVNVNASTRIGTPVAPDVFSLTNQGSLDLAADLDWSGGTFVNGTGGSINGGASSRIFMNGGQFTQGAGTTSGTEPVFIGNVALTYVGSGASRIVQSGVTTLSGNISAGQTLTILGNGTFGPTTITHVAAPWSNAGTIQLSSRDGGYSARLSGGTNAVVLTNTGLVEALPGVGGARYFDQSTVNEGGTLRANAVKFDSFVAGRTLTNRGVISAVGSGKFGWKGGTILQDTGGAISAPFSQSGGIFKQGAGTNSKTIALSGSNLQYLGSGAGTIKLAKSTGKVSGTIAAGQKLVIEGNGSAGHTTVTAISDLTNNGTIQFTSANGGYTSGIAGITAATALVNNGTVNVDVGVGGPRVATINVVNAGTFNVNQSLTSAGRTFTNTGVLNVANGMTMNWNGTVSNNAGSINGGTSGVVFIDGAQYDAGNGATTGAAPVVTRNAVVNFSATLAPPPASQVIAGGASCSILGTIKGQQTLVIEGSGFMGHTTCTRSTALANGGTIVLRSANGGYGAHLNAGANTVTNNGTILVQTGTGGARTITGNLANKKYLTVEAGVALSVVGDYSQIAGSKLTVNVLSAPAYGSVSATGSVALAGTLAIVTDPGFWPLVGQQYGVVNGASRTGTFSSVTGKTRSGEPEKYSEQYLAAGVRLDVV